MRFPIPLARILGNTTVNYRWFSIFYLLAMFFVLPFSVFALSCAGNLVFAIIAIPVIVILFIVILVNTIQAKRKTWLPLKYQTWDWLPYWMHSLDPIDRVITRFTSRCSCLDCIQSESRHDAGVLGIRANQSQLHILEAAKPMSEAHIMSAFENIGYGPWSQPHPNRNDVNGATPNNSPIGSPYGSVIPGSLHPFLAYGNSNHTWHGPPVVNANSQVYTNGVIDYHHHNSQGGILMKPIPSSKISMQTHLWQWRCCGLCFVDHLMSFLFSTRHHRSI